jgi:hypothetical protein
MVLSPHPSHRIRRTLLLATLSIVAGLLLAQCRSVTDNVFGRSSAAAKAKSCVTQCSDTANEQLRIESDLHTANAQACNGDPACLAAEETRHTAAVEAIQAARRACQSACHHQGGGTGR